jgi:hypothetical protein
MQETAPVASLQVVLAQIHCYWIILLSAAVAAFAIYVAEGLLASLTKGLQNNSAVEDACVHKFCVCGLTVRTLDSELCQMLSSSIPHFPAQVIQPASTVWSYAGTFHCPSLPISTESKVKFLKQIFMLDKNRDWHTRHAQHLNLKVPGYTLMGTKTVYLISMVGHLNSKCDGFSFH